MTMQDAAKDEAAARQAADAIAREAAQREFRRPLVLEAGAGTGKTMALVARVVVWALDPGWERARARLSARAASPDREPEPDRIASDLLQRVVAITFTEAAAAEMASRTAHFLAQIHAGELPLGIDARALPPDSPQRRERARALLGALDRFVVRTIHSFCRRLLAAHPVEAGLHPGFQVDGDGRGVEEVAREVLELRLREGYGDPGDPALLELAALGVGPPELEPDLVALLDAATPPEELQHDPFAPEALAPVVGELEATIDRVAALVAGRFEGRRRARGAQRLVEAMAQARPGVGSVAAGAAGFAALQGVLAAAFEGTQAKLKSWSRKDFTQTEREALGDDACPALAAAAADLSRQLDSLRGLDARRLDLARRALLPLLEAGARELRARGLVTYTGLLRAAHQLLLGHPTLCARQRAEIDQLLVDEFQDTDAVQCAVVEALALGGPEAERPGLFLVGDPKQSIYGWRSADLLAYERFVERVRQAGGQIHRLSVNYRSVESILGEVERSIRPVMHARPGLQPPFEPLLPHRTGKGFEQAGFHAVECWVSRIARNGEDVLRTTAADATRLEAAAVARDIARLVRDEAVPAGEIGILLHAFGDVEEYLAALREAGVPYAVERDRGYYQRREIIDAASLLRCVIDPADPLALLAFLRSPSVGVPDAALIPLWTGGFPALAAKLPASEAARKELRALAGRVAAAPPSDVPGLGAVAGWDRSLCFALDALASLRASFATDPSDLFVEKLRTRLLMEATEGARHLGAFRLANLERFFRELTAALCEGADAGAVLRHLRTSVQRQQEAEEGRPHDADAQAVRVMTIHRAKGLSFRHVYLVQLHRGRATGARPVARVAAHGGRTELCLVGEKSPGFTSIDRREEAIAKSESVRTLYVAMTRPRDRLVLAGLWPEIGAPDPKANSHMALLAQRAGGLPDLSALRRTLRTSGGGDRALASHVCWVFPALADPRVVPSLQRAEAAALATPLQVRADADALAAARARAQARMGRPLSGPISAGSHESRRESTEARREEELPLQRDTEDVGADGESRAIATAIGTAVHRALEEIDLRLPRDAMAAALRVTLDRSLEAALAGSALGEARQRAGSVVDRFVSGRLLEKLVALAPFVLARELPVLLAPQAGDQGPALGLVGTIDLVYRDPETRDAVVVDYKTDVVRGDEEIRQKAGYYSVQVARYARALRLALGLPRDPRFELWFLRADAIWPFAPTE